MIKLTNLGKKEIESISRHIADAFWDYDYSNGDRYRSWDLIREPAP